MNFKAASESTLAPSGTTAAGCSHSRTATHLTRRDQYQWKALLKEAGVREARLHDARHAAATTLLLRGVPERAVMDVMGWSNSAMVKRYADVTARLRRDIADR